MFIGLNVCNSCNCKNEHRLQNSLPGALLFCLIKKVIKKIKGCHFSPTCYGAFTKACKLVRLWRTSNSARFVPLWRDTFTFLAGARFEMKAHCCLRQYNNLI